MGPLTAATSVLRGLLQRKVLAVGVTAAAVGGGRLLHDEVRLARPASSDLVGQRREARRASQLVIDLAYAREDRRKLEASHAAVTSEALALAATLRETRGAHAATEGVLGQARQELARTQAEERRLGTALGAAGQEVAAREAALRSRQADLDSTCSDLAAAQRGLEAAELRARELAREVEGAREQAEALGVAVARLEARALDERANLAKVEGDLEGARRERVELVSRLTAADETRRRREAEAEELRGKLATAERERDARGARARAAEEALAKVARSGVNLDRLTGARPLPSISALVVQVDVDVVPPVVMIDAGSSSGLERGDRISIQRAGQQLAEVELDDVRPQLASGRVIRGQRGLRLRPGDAATTAPAR